MSYPIKIAPYRKRELSPLRRACLSLGLGINAKPETNLAWLLRKAGLGKTAIDYLRFSDDEQVRKIVALYDSLNTTERKAVTIDYLIMSAGLDAAHIWGCVNAELYRAAGRLACLAAPKVVRKLVESALKPNGYQDRRLLFQVGGVLPVCGQQGVAACRRWESVLSTPFSVH